MAEYIKRTDVMKICESYSEHCFNSNDSAGQDIADRILDDVVEIPTADVVEVVRCKGCKKWTAQHTCEEFTADRLPLRGKTTFITEPNDFCSYGERRDT